MTESTNVFASLGIDAGRLIWQIINFGILFFVLSKVLYKPILKKLDERTKLIKDGIKAAEDNLKKQTEAEAEREKLMQVARKDVEKIIEKAKKDAVITKEEIVQQAKDEAAKLMVKQGKEIDDKLAASEKALQSKVADLSVAVARKVLQDYLDKDKQQDLIEKQLSQIAKIKVTK